MQIEDTNNDRRYPTRTEMEKKLRLSFGLFAAAYAMKKHQLRKKHPEISDDDLKALTHACFERDDPRKIV